MAAVIGSLSTEILKRIERTRRQAVTRDQWAEVWRLEEIAMRAYELEALGERILTAVVRGRPLDAADPLEIPDFLRRH